MLSALSEAILFAACLQLLSSSVKVDVPHPSEYLVTTATVGTVTTLTIKRDGNCLQQATTNIFTEMISTDLKVMGAAPTSYNCHSSHCYILQENKELIIRL